MNEKLSMLIAAARKNPDLKRRLFKSRESAEPVLELCRIATDEGIPLTIEELLGAGQEYADNLLKSCNGGATNPSEVYDGEYGVAFSAISG